MEYITLESLREWRKNRIATMNCDYDEMQALGWFIETVPSIDIVRCVECKHNTDSICRKHYWVVSADGFCEKGERK